MYTSSSMELKDIEIRRVLQSSDPYKGTELQLLFEGKNIDNVVMNTIRQTVHKEIPIYAPSVSTINIDANNTYYDHYEMRSRLSLIPIPKIKSEVTYLDPMYYPYVKSVIGSVKPDREYARDPKDTTNINFYINVENKSPEIMNITTNDLKVTIDGKDTKNVFDAKHPDLIIRLRKNHKFECSYHAVLGIAKLNVCWSAVSNITYGKTKNGNYFMKLRSLGQLTEWECLTQACDIIIIKFNKILKNILAEYKDVDDTKILRFIIKNESHLIGRLLSHITLKHPKVSFCGYCVDHQLDQAVTIEIKTIDKYLAIDALKDAVAYINKLYTNIKKELLKTEKTKFTPNKVLEKVTGDVINDEESNELIEALKQEVESTKKKVESDSESEED